MTALLTGCDFAPAYHTPDMPAPDAYKEAVSTDVAAAWQPASPADTMPRGPWWEIFGDTGLNELEAKVAGANQDIKAAVARFDQARAAAASARAAYFPTVTGTGAADRNQASATVANARPTRVYNDFSLGLDFSYELDLWGRVRNSVAAATATASASESDLAAVDLSTHAELASDYFTLRGDDARQATLDQTVQAYEQALTLTTSRFKGGAGAESDVDQAETQLETAKTEAADLRLQRAQLEHAIAILVGVPASQFTLPPAQFAESPPAIAAGLPASLLERRPDVAAAERRAAAANAQIGVARAAFFPTISLGAILGTESQSTAQLFATPSRMWTLGPSATLPLFDAGARSAAEDEAVAVYDENAADYRQTVLGAYRDVEDNLVALDQLASEAVSQDKAVAAAERALAQAHYRYTGGIVTYLEVVSSQNAALQAELSAADIRARRMIASVLLVKALGGGWEHATAS
jgi:NodT family efflux transporter outer membrane factor (OMF) lipoprotein